MEIAIQTKPAHCTHYKSRVLKGVVKIDIAHLIDRLERLLNSSRRVPLTSGAIVNRDESLEIIDQMRVTIPQEIAKARRIQEERDKVLALAQEEAERLVDRAHSEAEQVLDERGLLDEAQERSAAIVDESRRQAEDTMRGADEYAIRVLGQLEDELIAVQTTIRNGLEILQQEERRRRLSAETGLEDLGAATEGDGHGEPASGS